MVPWARGLRCSFSNFFFKNFSSYNFFLFFYNFYFFYFISSYYSFLITTSFFMFISRRALFSLFLHIPSIFSIILLNNVHLFVFAIKIEKSATM